MMNTVPAAVTLSDPVTVRPWLMVKTELDLTSTGAVSFSGIIGAHGTPAPPSTATYQYGTVGGGNTGTRTSQAGGMFFFFLRYVVKYYVVFESNKVSCSGPTRLYFWWKPTSTY
jgi:hypothetical protein